MLDNSTSCYLICYHRYDLRHLHLISYCNERIYDFAYVIPLLWHNQGTRVFPCAFPSSLNEFSIWKMEELLLLREKIIPHNLLNRGYHCNILAVLHMCRTYNMLAVYTILYLNLGKWSLLLLHLVCYCDSGGSNNNKNNN